MDQLKDHQRKFMSIAFTKLPESLDIEKFMYTKPERLFLQGLISSSSSFVSTRKKYDRKKDTEIVSLSTKRSPCIFFILVFDVPSRHDYKLQQVYLVRRKTLDLEDLCIRQSISFQ